MRALRQAARVSESWNSRQSGLFVSVGQRLQHRVSFLRRPACLLVHPSPTVVLVYDTGSIRVTVVMTGSSSAALLCLHAVSVSGDRPRPFPCRKRLTNDTFLDKSY
jgi:hypothetical protein